MAGLCGRMMKREDALSFTGGFFSFMILIPYSVVLLF